MTDDLPVPGSVWRRGGVLWRAVETKNSGWCYFDWPDEKHPGEIFHMVIHVDALHDYMTLEPTGAAPQGTETP